MALSEFQKAFKAARASGEKEFEYEGKKYNTKYKEESESSVKPSAAKSSSSSTPREAAIAESNDQTSPAPSAPKKEYYRNLSGKMVEKTPAPASDEDGGFLGKRFREAMGSSYKKGGSVRSSASSRADGIAQRGKTKGRIV